MNEITKVQIRLLENSHPGQDHWIYQVYCSQCNFFQEYPDREWMELINFLEDHPHTVEMKPIVSFIRRYDESISNRAKEANGNG